MEYKRLLLIVSLLFVVSVESYSASVEYPTYWKVAKDGSGDFTTIQQAVNQCKSFPDVKITIFIKKGVYKEKLVINAWNTNITLLGEDKENTIITYDDAAKKIKNGTFWTYTMIVRGNDFTAQNLTIANTAGTEYGQAVALNVHADRVVIKNCKLLANQDTLYTSLENSRQLYENCYIEGTTDYIFGAATALFRNCVIHSKKDSFITAASTPERVRFGYVFLDCKLTYAKGITRVYLGRPWRKFAKTVFIKCDLGDNIRPAGWKEWSGKFAETHYAEYKCTGKSADRSARVDWSHELTDKQAKEYTVENIFAGKYDKTQNEKKWHKQ